MLHIEWINGATSDWNLPFSEGLEREIKKNTKALMYPVLVQADGDELEHIQSRFANLPYAHRICTWRGEMARFILDNL